MANAVRKTALNDGADDSGSGVKRKRATRLQRHDERARGNDLAVPLAPRRGDALATAALSVYACLPENSRS